MDGVEQLLCCSVEGEIKGFKATAASVIDEICDRNVNQDNIRELSQRKQNLLLEIKNLEEASKPSVREKIDEFGERATGIPVSKNIC
jgi:Bardet-Biedl syndrome 2 protein